MIIFGLSRYRGKLRSGVVNLLRGLGFEAGARGTVGAAERRREPILMRRSDTRTTELLRAQFRKRSDQLYCRHKKTDISRFFIAATKTNSLRRL